jgi:hypothetical protein
MRLPSMTTRRWMVVVAIIAVLYWGVFCEPFGGLITVSTAFGGLFALGAMRHPWLFLPLAVALRAVVPPIPNGSADSYFRGCYQFGWFLGASAGVIVRMVRRRADRRCNPPGVPSIFD